MPANPDISGPSTASIINKITRIYWRSATAIPSRNPLNTIIINT